MAIIRGGFGSKLWTGCRSTLVNTSPIIDLQNGCITKGKRKIQWINHYGQPDVAMFDFTCMYASENAALVREHNGHQLLVALVGDSLLEVRAGVRGGMTRNMGSQAGSVCVILPCRVQPRGSEPAELGLGPARLLGGRAVCPATTSSQGQSLSLLRSLVSLY